MQGLCWRGENKCSLGNAYELHLKDPPPRVLFTINYKSIDITQLAVDFHHLSNVIYIIILRGNINIPAYTQILQTLLSKGGCGTVNINFVCFLLGSFITPVVMFPLVFKNVDLYCLRHNLHFWNN